MTNTPNESAFDLRCAREECATRPLHPAKFHQFDEDIAKIADDKRITRVLDAVFEQIWDMIIDCDLPYPIEGDSDDDDIVDEFRDWATNRVIRAYFK